LCQARRGGNAPTRSYYDEGEFVPGAPAQSYYYGPDQIGSPRRVFASPTTAPAYDYDPYGVPLQGTAPLTDFGYAGMFYNADSGLYLTLYRAYDPVAGRWLSRDPMGEVGDPTVYAALSTMVPDVVSSTTALGGGGTDLYYNQERYYSSPLGPFVSKDPIGLEGGVNLYGYVNQSPTRFTDPYGEKTRADLIIHLIRVCFDVIRSFVNPQVEVPPDKPKPEITRNQPPETERKSKPGFIIKKR
jgi:RHS repeat-associated protein